MAAKAPQSPVRRLGGPPPTRNAPPPLTIAPKATKHLDPIPHEKWPLWSLAIARLKKEGETGLGDTITRMIGHSNSERFKAWFQRKFGKSCGCEERRVWLNRKYPYL